jgi:hypothetical protein
MYPYEIEKEIKIPEGEPIKIIETFCTDCLGKYVHNVEDLVTKEYAFEYMTELFNNNFTKYEE